MIEIYVLLYKLRLFISSFKKKNLTERILYGGAAVPPPLNNLDDESSDDQMNDHSQNEISSDEDEPSPAINSFDSLLTFSLSATTQDGLVREYDGEIDAHPSIALNWEAFLLSVVRRSLIRQIMSLLNEMGLGLKVFWQLNCTFVRKIGKNETQSVFVPFRQESVVYSLLDENLIAQSIQDSVEVAIQKQKYFENMGSGWVLESYLGVMIRVAHLGHQLGNIGRTNVGESHLRLYGPNASFHIASDQRLILPNILFSFCDTENLCFAYSIGCSLFEWDELKASTDMSLPALKAFKQDVLNRAFQTYDFSMISTFPCSFTDISDFLKANSNLINLCVMGLYQSKSGDDEKQFRSKTIRVWPLLKTVDLAKNPKNLRTVHLVVTKEHGCQQSNTADMTTFHVAYCNSFQRLMKRAHKLHDGRLTEKVFCESCFCSFKPSEISKHRLVCGSVDPTTLTIQRFHARGKGAKFSYEQKRRPVICMGSMDLECASKPLRSAAERGMFGPMSETRSQFVPVSFSSQSYLNVEGAEKYQLLCKSYVGPDTLLHYFRLLFFESAYFTSLLCDKLVFPMRITREQKAAAEKATHCGNCKKQLLDDSKHYHHDHAISPEAAETNFIGVLCGSCNGKFRRKTEYYLSCHNLKSFESAFIVRNILVDSRCSDLFEDVKIFCKGADNVSSLKLTFKCFLCHPELLMNERLNFLVPSNRQEIVNHALDLEFRRMKTTIRDYIETERLRHRIPRSARATQLQNEAVLAEALVHQQASSDEDDDEEEDEEEEEEEGEAEEEEEEEEEEGEFDAFTSGRVPSADLNQSRVDETVQETPIAQVDEAKKKCPHGKSFRTVIVKDSLAITCASLEKTVNACAQNFQPKICGENVVNSGFWLQPVSKDCACCRHLYNMTHQGQVLCNFCVDYYGDLNLVDVSFSKALFPYSYVDKLIDDEGNFIPDALNDPIPSRCHFKNELSDSDELPSEAAYEKLLSLLQKVGVTNFADYLLFYNSGDTLELLVALLTIERFYFEHFDSSVLRYNSLPRFAYDILLRSCLEKEGGDGSVDFLASESERLYLKEANCGGIQLCSTAGGPVDYMNCIELPRFSPVRRQKKTVTLDINSLFPWAFFAFPLPKSSYRLHDEDSVLVRQMNDVLAERGRDGFIEFYKDLVEKNSTYYLIEVSISYPDHVHDLLDIPPSFRKRRIHKTELSEDQRALLEKLGLKTDFRQAVLVNDLNPQKVIVSFLHLCLLAELDVTIEGFSRVMTAFQSYCFRDAIGKMLALKRNASSPYFRSLAKQCANSSYGVTGLVPERYECVGVARGRVEIVRAVSSPYLNRFKILSPTAILTYSQKQSVHCESLFFMNVAIQQNAKTYFLRTYYFGIKQTLTAKCLQLGLRQVEVFAKYVDTDSATIVIECPAYNDCQVYLRTSDLFYALRHVMDFGSYLPHPNHSLFLELKSSLSTEEFEDFISLIRSTQSAPGLFKSELDVSGYCDEVEFFYTLRSKAYLLKAFHRPTADISTPTYTYKKTLKGPVLRERLKKLGEDEYKAMGEGISEYENKMSKIATRNWGVYLTSLNRRRPTIFSKTRFLIDASSGRTRPHGHKSNPHYNRVSSVEIINSD